MHNYSCGHTEFVTKTYLVEVTVKASRENSLSESVVDALRAGGIDAEIKGTASLAE